MISVKTDREATNMIVIEHLEKKYKGTDKGIRDISLHVEKGDLFAFIGHNGAGKTTLLKCITGIHDFDKGKIIIDGTDLEQNPMECKRKFAYIPDNPDLYEYLTGMQYLNFIGDVFQVSAENRKERIEKYGQALEILPDFEELIKSYSHGMKQKLAILSALIHEPKLLILDEPFVGLDPKATVTLKGIMREICDRGGAIFFSTHVLEVAEKLCNKVAIIKNGELIATGRMDELVNEGESLEDVFMEVLNSESDA